MQIIGSAAFSLIIIEEIYIPPKITKICKGAFHLCNNLRKIEIPTNSNLRTIEAEAFSGQKKEGIVIPPKVSNW